ncbi:MAG: hypothetical protein Q9184_007231 [Pyrenodesmia sp. 2 TL-2023]
MNRLARISEESFTGDKDDHSEEWSSKERPMCRECEYRRQRWFRHSVAIPWIISFALLTFCIALELSSARSQARNSAGYWKETDFGEMACSISGYEMRRDFKLTNLLYRKLYDLLQGSDTMGRTNWFGRLTRTYLNMLARRLPSLMLLGRIWWEVRRPRRNLARWLMNKTAVNVFVTAQEEPGLGGNLYLEPDSRLYMAEYTSLLQAISNKEESTDRNLTQADRVSQSPLFGEKNMIRQSLPFYWDYYQHKADAVLQQHLGTISLLNIMFASGIADVDDCLAGLLDHCIDNLRESLMCTGDMTFSPTVWDSNKGRFIPDFEVEHTCRDYDALKRWSLARDSADKDRWKANAARLHKQSQR